VCGRRLVALAVGRLDAAAAASNGGSAAAGEAAGEADAADTKKEEAKPFVAFGGAGRSLRD